MIDGRWRWVWTTLNVVPLPGVGALVVGARNPHTRLAAHGAAQALLVVFGTWPLVLPGLAGLTWAIFDAVQIARAEVLAKPGKDV